MKRHCTNINNNNNDRSRSFILGSVLLLLPGGQGISGIKQRQYKVMIDIVEPIT